MLVVFTMGFIESNRNEQSEQLKSHTMDKQDKKQIENLLSEYKESLNTSDAVKAMNLYTKDGIFMPTEAPSAQGHESVQGAYEFVFSQIQLNIEFFIDEIVIDRDVAYATTMSKGTTLIHANGVTVPEENRELFVFERENSAWKIARYMFNKTSPQK